MPSFSNGQNAGADRAPPICLHRAAPIQSPEIPAMPALPRGARVSPVLVLLLAPDKACWRLPQKYPAEIAGRRRCRFEPAQTFRIPVTRAIPVPSACVHRATHKEYSVPKGFPPPLAEATPASLALHPDIRPESKIAG